MVRLHTAQKFHREKIHSSVWAYFSPPLFFFEPPLVAQRSRCASPPRLSGGFLRFPPFARSDCCTADWSRDGRERNDGKYSFGARPYLACCSWLIPRLRTTGPPSRLRKLVRWTHVADSGEDVLWRGKERMLSRHDPVAVQDNLANAGHGHRTNGRRRSRPKNKPRSRRGENSIRTAS